MTTNNATAAPLSVVEEDPLALAKYLIRHGSPVFIAAPNLRYNPTDDKSGSEFHFPRGWPTLEANPHALDGWTPQHAVCAVTGVHFDVIDVDPRNGGFDSMVKILTAKVEPPIYGEIATPSDGFHLYICRTGRAKGTPLEGIDLQAGDAAGNGRGFVYIPPTVRTNKLTGEPAPYRITTPIEMPKLKGGVNDPAAEIFLRFLHIKMPPKQEQAPAVAWQARAHTDRELKYLERAIISMAEEVEAAPEGSRNNTLNAKAYKAGQMIAGCGAPEAWVLQVLTIASDKAGLKKSESYVTIRSAIKKGKTKPIAPGPFSDAERNRAAPITDAEFDEYMAWNNDIEARLIGGKS